MKLQLDHTDLSILRCALLRSLHSLWRARRFDRAGYNVIIREQIYMLRKLRTCSL